MKNKLENKAKFFCLYHGQNVMKTATPYGYSALMKVDYIASKNQAYFLELTPLSQISDEDAVSIGYSNSDTFLEQQYIECGFLSSNESDKLRYLGYAVPYMGI